VSIGSPLKGMSFHPSSANVVLTRSAHEVHLLDLELGESRIVTTPLPDNDITSAEWSWSGDLMATLGKDQTLRVYDPRAGSDEVMGKENAHQSHKTSKCLFLDTCSPNLLFSSGFSVSQDREMCLWDARNMGECLKRERLDGSTGMLFPLFDPDTNLLVVMGKGDTNIRLFEVDPTGKFTPISNTSTSGITRGGCLVGKQAMDLMGCEVNRVLQLTELIVKPITFKVPRRQKTIYHEDLYPSSYWNAEPAVFSSSDWFEGETSPPNTVDIEPPQGKNVSFSESKEQQEEVEEEGEESKGEDDGFWVDPEREERIVKIRSGFSHNMKFKHIYGKENTKERTYFNCNPLVGSSDINLITTSDLFWACPWQGAGGPVYVSKHGNFGKIEPGCPLLNGHRSSVLALEFSPFDPSLLLTGSDDCTCKIWRLPPDGPTELFDENWADGTLNGHNNGIRTINFNPVAENIVATSAMDIAVKTWDIGTQTEVSSISFECPETMANLSWNYNGSLLAAMGKDRIIRVIDPRQSTLAHSSEPCLRNAHLVWTHNRSEADAIVVAGVGGGGARQITAWDPRNLSSATCTRQIDHASGQLFPLYDEDCQILYVTGKGDTTIRMYELTFEEGACLINHANDYQSAGEGMKGLGMLPKRSCDVRDVEVAKMIRLAGDTITPLSLKLPRSEALKEYFQDDVFVDTKSLQPPIVADEWVNGRDGVPELQSLAPEGMTPLSEKPAEKVKVSSARVMREHIQEEEEKEKAREEVFSKLQNMAIQRSKFHPNVSMGVKGVDATPIYDSESDDDWDD